MNTDYLSYHTHFLRTPARTQTCPCSPDGIIFLRTQTASSLRVVDFPDRQNLYHSPKSALCNGGDDYNPKVLATLIEKRQRWHLVQTRFYSAISDQNRYQINAKILSLQSFLMNRDDCKTTARISVYNELTLAAN